MEKEGKLANLRSEAEASNALAEEYEAKIKQLELESTSKDHELLSIQIRAKNLEDQLDKAEAQLQLTSAKYNEADLKAEEAERTVQKLEQELIDKEQHYEDILEKYTGAKAELDELARQFDEFNSIKADPYNNHIYQKTTKAPERNNQIEVETKKIVSQAQLINFLNIAFLPVNPNNEESYARKNLSMNDILSVAWKYSDIFSEKTAYGFEDIVSHSPRYQRFIQSLKDEGYHVIGYVRKSICEKDDDSRVRLLNLMCENLNNRSLVSKVFASVYCNANEPLLEGSTEI
ncbi:hypothetical protein HPULCUR_010041 [Helicostylum pulchrum]|uniref:Uncharacterized protein n=1 Tax=Helicostylum pulchrum TaxID=562976 RepID=A0ABP9YC45_9FUNG